MYLLFVGLACGVLMAVIAIYIRNVLSGSIGMNLTTWAISTVATWIQTITYFWTATEPLLLAMSIIMSVGVTTIMVLAWRGGNFPKWKLFDKIVAGITLLCVVVGAIVTAAVGATLGGKVANVIVQLALFMSMVPTYLDLRAKRISDDPLPWGLAVYAYVFQTIAAVLAIEIWTSDWPQIVNPILVGLCGNGMVTFAAYRNKRQGS